MKKEIFLKKLGCRIKELRSRKGISQAELARLCERERASMERIENGKVNTSVYMIYEIAAAIDSPMQEFFDIE